MRIERGAPALTLHERVENLSGRGAPSRLGPPLRRRRRRSSRPAAGCDAAGAHDRHAARGLGGHGAARARPARAVAARAAARRRARPTCARCRAPSAARHDDVFLTDLDDGTVAVENPRLGRTFRLALRPRAVPLAVRLAALRRRARAAARGLLRARHRAVGLARATSRHAVAAGEAIELAGRRGARDDPDRRHRGRTRRMRAARVLETVGCDAFVASDPFTVAWLTGFAADETWGPNPFAAPPLAVVRTRRVRRRDRERGRGAGARRAAAARSSPTRASRSARSTRSPAGARRSPRSACAAAWRSRTPRCRCPGVEAVQADAHALRLLRAVKDDDEIARIRARDRALRRRPGGRARRAARRRQRARGVGRGAERDGGRGRRAALAAVRLRDRRAHGRGRRPAGRRASSRDGDLAIVDLVPRLGRLLRRLLRDDRDRRARPPSVRSAHARCSEALERGLAALAPGHGRGRPRRARARSGLDYPHHTGHGVGVAAHEEPRIVPGGETVLAPGMIVALEPGTYPGPWGMRVERLALVTETGCEILCAARPLALTLRGERPRPAPATARCADPVAERRDAGRSPWRCRASIASSVRSSGLSPPASAWSRASITGTRRG